MNSAAKVPIAALEDAIDGIKRKFKSRSMIAPAISEYNTTFSCPNGTNIWIPIILVNGKFYMIIPYFGTCANAICWNAKLRK